MTTNKQGGNGGEYREIELGGKVPTVAREYLTGGVECDYLRTETYGTAGDETIVHIFKSHSKQQEFGVFDTAQLGAKLRQVKAGQAVLIKYEGKGDHPTNPNRTTHNWTVKVKGDMPPAAARVADPAELPF